MSEDPPRTAPRTTTPQRTCLGFDYGLRRIGVAVGETLTGSARPLQTVAARDGEPDWDALGGLIRSWEPDALVVGVPLHLDGARQPMTDAAQRFARRLEGRYRLPVHRVDERLSSDEARRVLAERGVTGRAARGRLDPVAAQIILETWLNRQVPDTHDPDTER